MAKRRLGSYEAYVRTFVKTLVRKINDGKRPFSLHYEYSLYYECTSLKKKGLTFYRMFVLSLVEVLCGQHGVPHDAGLPHAAGVPHAARTVQDHRQKCQLARKYLTPAATSTDV